MQTEKSGSPDLPRMCTNFTDRFACLSHASRSANSLLTTARSTIQEHVKNKMSTSVAHQATTGICFSSACLYCCPLRNPSRILETGLANQWAWVLRGLEGSISSHFSLLQMDCVLVFGTMAGEIVE